MGSRDPFADPIRLSWEEQDRLPSRATGPPVANCIRSRCHHGLQEAGTPATAKELGSSGTATGYQCIHSPCNDAFQSINSQERIPRAQLDCPPGGTANSRVSARSSLITYRGRPTLSILKPGLEACPRIGAGLPKVRVHDLRHTFGHRLMAGGVSYEDRQDLLGHKPDRITTHYSEHLTSQDWFEAAESVCTRRPNTGLRIAAHTNLTQSRQDRKSGIGGPLVTI